MIGIYFRHKNDLSDVTNIRGPIKVILNLISGLRKLNIKYNLNSSGEYNISLSPPKYKSIFSLPPNTYIGPNVLNTKKLRYDIIEKLDNFIVPSEMIKKVFENYIKEKQIHVWPSGIDTDFFNVKKQIKYDALVYVKHRTDYTSVVNILDKLNLKYVILHYGSYDDDMFLNLNKICKFMILIDKSETQGISNMEAMSCNTPIFALDYNVMFEPFNNVELTSLPYFDSSCGIKLPQKIYFNDDLLQLELIKFIDNINNYFPRDYILKYHTLKRSAENLINIISK